MMKPVSGSEGSKGTVPLLPFLLLPPHRFERPCDYPFFDEHRRRVRYHEQQLADKLRRDDRLAQRVGLLVYLHEKIGVFRNFVYVAFAAVNQQFPFCVWH